MSEAADFVVMEPGELLVPGLEPLVPTISVAVPLGGTERPKVNLEVSEAGIAEIADVLHRLGGEALLGELGHALGNAVRGDNSAQSRLASDALRLLEREIVEIRRASIEHLQALDFSIRRAFEYDLAVAVAGLQPESFGLHLDADGTVTVLAKQGDPKPYSMLRENIVILHQHRTIVRSWAFPRPRNAARARQQFEESAQQPYLEALADVAQIWPAMNVMAPRLSERLKILNENDIVTWVNQDSTQTPLDEVIQNTLVEAYVDLSDMQPTYRQETLQKADKAINDAAWQVTNHLQNSPATVLGRENPLFRHAFLVQAALEEQGYLPGDHGHALAASARAAAVAELARSRRATAEMDHILGWSSLGFGLASIIPVVGQLALVAAIVAGAIQAVEETARYLETSALSRALGQQAPDYDVADPEALGMVVAWLGLLSDAGLPVVGKLIGKAILAPASRALAAARVAKVLNLGERATDLAGMALTANAAVVEHELQRVGLLGPQAGTR